MARAPGRAAHAAGRARRPRSCGAPAGLGPADVHATGRRLRPRPRPGHRGAPAPRPPHRAGSGGAARRAGAVGRGARRRRRGGGARARRARATTAARARVPSDLAAEIARTGSEAAQVWVDARRRSDFALFQPHLERNVELRRRVADCFADEVEHPYDALLDVYEPELTTAQVRGVFADLRAGLVPLIDADRGGAAAARAARALRRARPARGRAGDRADLRLRRRGLADGPRGAPVLPVAGPERHPRDQPLRPGRPERDLRRDARGRPRPLRARGRSRPCAHDARDRRLAGHPRVPEPAVGELRRPQPALLAALAPAPARAHRRRRPRRAGHRRLLPRGQRRAAGRRSASTPTR